MRFDLMGEHTGIPRLQVAIMAIAALLPAPGTQLQDGRRTRSVVPHLLDPTITFTFPASYLKLDRTGLS